MKGGKDDLMGGARYYANPSELKILVQGLQRYFALPERSQNRNKIAKEVSQYLSYFSSHWSHRAVRLWFNNNKRTYLNVDPNNPNLANIGVGSPAAPPDPSMPMQSPHPPPQPQSPIQSKLDTSLLLPQFIPKNPQDMVMLPPMNPPPLTERKSVILPPMTQIPRNDPSPINPPPNILPPYRSPIQQNQVVLSPFHPQKDPMVTFPAFRNSPKEVFVMPPIQASPVNASMPEPLQKKDPIYSPVPKEPSREQLYIPISALLNEIRRTNKNDPRFPKQLADFDEQCANLISKFGRIQPERIEPMTKFLHFPFNNNESTTDFPESNIPDSMSSSDLNALPRTVSFTRQLYATDINRDIAPDQFAPTNIWQIRGYSDKFINFNFESLAMSDDVAAFATVQIGNNRVISLHKLNEPTMQWQSITVNIKTGIESMCLDNDSTWLYSNHLLYQLPFNSPIHNPVNIPISIGGGNVSCFGNGVVACYSQSSQLHFVNKLDEICSFNTSYKGFTCACEINDHLACGIAGSGTFRNLNSQCVEERTFVGHCGQVLGIEKLSENLLVSRSEDSTVRVWDIRKEVPVTQISPNHVSVLSLSGDERFLVCGFHHKTIGVFDLRKPEKSILGVQTQDYEPVLLKYNSSDDFLSMFGVIDKDSNKDSMLFMDNNGLSRQRVFRKYNNFVGIET